MSTDLKEAKQRLVDRLGPNYDIYIQLLGKWFRGSISKDEFDKSAKQMIENNIVLEHNKFWLSFFHHCANSTSSSISSQYSQMNDSTGTGYNLKSREFEYGDKRMGNTSESNLPFTDTNLLLNGGSKVRCLPNKVITHMKTFVIAWEMGLDSTNDNVSLYINLALQHFLKNIITELVCTKTAYRLRENRFKHAIGVKPMNPYLNNSLKIYSTNLEYDPYQIESNKMNSSLVDTYAYNDSLFPSRLYEAQALYEFACSTATVDDKQLAKRMKLSKLDQDCEDNVKRLTMFHLLIAFLTNRTIIPSQSMYSLNLERIFSKLSNQ